MTKRQVMRGKELQKAIMDLAHLCGWKVAHFPSAQILGRDGTPKYRTALHADGKGFPDLVLVRPGGRVIFAEVKGDGDRLRTEQRHWLDWLASAGAEVHLWMPPQWKDGEIETILRR